MTDELYRGQTARSQTRPIVEIWTNAFNELGRGFRIGTEVYSFCLDGNVYRDNGYTHFGGRPTTFLGFTPYDSRLRPGPLRYTDIDPDTLSFETNPYNAKHAQRMLFEVDDKEAPLIGKHKLVGKSVERMNIILPQEDVKRIAGDIPVFSRYDPRYPDSRTS